MMTPEEERIEQIYLLAEREEILRDSNVPDWQAKAKADQERLNVRQAELFAVRRSA